LGWYGSALAWAAVHVQRGVRACVPERGWIEVPGAVPEVREVGGVSRGAGGNLGAVL
jgi:hypothetical protein